MASTAFQNAIAQANQKAAAQTGQSTAFQNAIAQANQKALQQNAQETAAAQRVAAKADSYANQFLQEQQSGYREANYINAPQEQAKRNAANDRIDTLQDNAALLQSIIDSYDFTGYQDEKYGIAKQFLGDIQKEIQQVDAGAMSQQEIDRRVQIEAQQKAKEQAQQKLQKSLNLNVQQALRTSNQIDALQDQIEQYQKTIDAYEESGIYDEQYYNTKIAENNAQRQLMELIGSESYATGAEIEQAQKLQRLKELESVQGNRDYGKKSGYDADSGISDSEWSMWRNTYDVTGDIVYDYINNRNNARSIDMVNSLLNGATAAGVDLQRLKQMDKDEIGVYNYLYATQGKTAAEEYLQLLSSDLNARQMKQTTDWWKEYAEQHPVAASAASVAMSPLRGASYLGQIADYAKDGSIDENAAYNRYAAIPGTIRETVSEKIEKSWGGQPGSFLYQTGMSMADFLMQTALTGSFGASGVGAKITEAATLAIMGTGAAADGTLAAKKRGLSDQQAFALGTIAGAAEVLTEKISVETLLDMTNLDKNMVGYLLKNTLAEGSEEVGSDFVNLFADILIAKDKSEWAQSVESWKQAGYEGDSAWWKAFSEQAAGMGLDFLGGALSGFVMAGGSTIIHNAIGAVETAKDRAEFVSAMEQIAQTLPEEQRPEKPPKLASAKQAQEYGKNVIQALSQQEEQIKAETGTEQAAPADINDSPYVRELQRQLNAGEITEADFDDLYEEYWNGTGGDVEQDAFDAGMERSAERDLIESQTQNQAQQEEQRMMNEARSLLDAGTNPAFVAARTGYGMDTEGNLRKIGGQSNEVLLSGSSQRQNGTGTGGQIGAVAGSTGAAANTGGTRSAAAANPAVARLRAVEGTAARSAADIGVTGGSQTRNLRVIPADTDAELQAIYTAGQGLGMEVVFVDRQIEVRNQKTGAVKKMNGVIENGRVIINAGSRTVSATGIWHHELYHAMDDGNSGSMTQYIWADLEERYTPEVMQQLLAQTIAAYDGIYDGRENALDLYKAEVIADLYGGLNAEKNTAAAQMQQTVREIADDTRWNAPEAIQSGEERYAIKELPDGRKYVKADRQVIFGNDPESWSEQLEDYINGKIRRGENVQIIAEDGDILTLTGETAGKVSSMYNNDGTAMSEEAFERKVNAGAHIDELAEVSVRGKRTVQDENARHGAEAERGWNYRRAFFQDFDGKYYLCTISVMQGSNGNAVYNIGEIKERSFPSVQKALRGSSGGSGAQAGEVSFDDSVAQTEPKVKENLLEGLYSVATEEDDMQQQDSEGRELSAQQQEFFSDSKVRNKNGFLRPVFHYTNERFTQFEQMPASKQSRKTLGDGFYVSTNLREFEDFGKYQMEMYANITNPFEKEMSEDEANKVYDKYFAPLHEDKFGTYRPHVVHSLTVPYKVFDYLKEAAEANGTTTSAILSDLGYDGVHSGIEWVAFNSNQLKNVKNLNPTKNEDIRYSVSEDENVALQPQVEQPEQTGWVQDEDGNWAQQEPTQPMSAFEAAQAAGRQIAAETQQTKTGAQIRETMKTKARDYLARTERSMVRKLSEVLSIPRNARSSLVQQIAEEISNEYLENGQIRREAADRIFERAYSEGRVVDEEYYNDYKPVKDYIRNTGITISAEDRNSIPDFQNWRKDNFGTVKIVNDGLSVDAAYQELQAMAPGLFPDSLTHPADQLQHMAQVAKGIVKVEHNLNAVYGEQAEDFKRFARNDFNAALSEHMLELETVRRYNQETEKTRIETPTTTEEAMEVYRQMKDARREHDKTRAKTLLPDEDAAIVYQLLRGERTVETLPDNLRNRKAILENYEARKAYEDLARVTRAWKTQHQEQLRDKADKALENANNWKDKGSGLQYSRETMERNIQDIVAFKEDAQRLIEEYFDPVHKAVAEATRFKNRYRDRVEKLDLSRKIAKGNLVSEAHAVQLLGEALDNIGMMEASRGRMEIRDGKTLAEWRAVVTDLWANNPNMDQKKIENAVKEFRKIYDEIFEQMNTVRVRNGYEPVNYRSGYFPHFQPGDSNNIFGRFGKILGVSTEVQALPTSINGLTHTFKPGITWMGNAQERLGFNTVYDAVEGFDKYIEGAADVIHLTDAIQNLRALASQIRYRTTDDGIRNQVDEIRARENLSEEEKKTLIDQVYQNGKFTLSRFVVELDEYTNLLANKKSRHDRDIEADAGRKIYNIAKALEGRVAANMVAINPASWLTNFGPLAQAWGEVSSRDILTGMWDTLKSYRSGESIIDRSTFLTNRQGSDVLVQSWEQTSNNPEWVTTLNRAQGAASKTLSTPMEWIDMFTAESVVRARTSQNIRAGMSEELALDEADHFASGLMADRSKGALPTVFARKNPFVKVFTQFQVEVNNTLSYVFKDLPRKEREKGVAALALALLKFMLGSWLYNQAYEALMGRRCLLDPIGILNESVGDFTGYELPNIFLAAFGKDDFTTTQKKPQEAVKSTAANLAEELPFVGGLLGGGRVPISSAMPDMGNLTNAIFSDTWSGKKKGQTLYKELSKPVSYVLLPFGGGQLKKFYEGIEGTVRGGSYTTDAEGNDVLQYPIQNQTAFQAAMSAGRSMLFGKSTLGAARDWVDSDFKNLSAKNTAVYQALTDAGMDQMQAFEFVRQIYEIEKTDEASAAELKRQALAEANIPPEYKNLAYYGMLASDSEKATMDKLADRDADAAEIYNVMAQLKDAQKTDELSQTQVKNQILRSSALSEDDQAIVYYDQITDKDGREKIDGMMDNGDSLTEIVKTMTAWQAAENSSEKRTALIESGLSDESKIEMYHSITKERDDDIEAFETAGLSLNDYMRVQNVYTQIDDEGESASDKAVLFAKWLDDEGFTTKQTETARETFTYGYYMRAEADKYDELTGAGLNSDKAYQLQDAIKALQPEAGKETVSEKQKIAKIAASSLTAAEQEKALTVYASEGTVSKYNAVKGYGVDVKTLAKFQAGLQEADDGNGNYSQAEVKAAINALFGTSLMQDAYRKQAAALWQMANKSWKPKNNPYSTQVSQAVYDTLNG